MSTRMSLNVTDRAVAARDRIAGRSDGNATDVVNRSLIILDRLWELSDDGCLTVVRPDGTQVLVMLP